MVSVVDWSDWTGLRFWDVDMALDGLGHRVRGGVGSWSFVFLRLGCGCVAVVVGEASPAAHVFGSRALGVGLPRVFCGRETLGGDAFCALIYICFFESFHVACVPGYHIYKPKNSDNYYYSYTKRLNGRQYY